MEQIGKPRGIWEWNLVKWILGLSLILVTVPFVTQGFGEEANRLAIRWTARISFTLFCLAFVASSLHLVLQQSLSYWLVYNRRFIGISFAVIHLVHLAFLGMLQACFHPVFNLAKTTSLLGGGVAYGFVVLMLLTSFPFFSRRLSPNNGNPSIRSGDFGSGRFS